MSEFINYLIRFLPIFGSLVFTTYYIGYSMNYKYDCKKIKSYPRTLEEEAMILKFTNKSSEDGKKWTQKRVHRPWEDT